MLSECLFVLCSQKFEFGYYNAILYPLFTCVLSGLEPTMTSEIEEIVSKKIEQISEPRKEEEKNQIMNEKRQFFKCKMWLAE